MLISLHGTGVLHSILFFLNPVRPDSFFNDDHGPIHPVHVDCVCRITQPVDPDGQSKALISSLGIVKFLHREYLSSTPFFSNTVRSDPCKHNKHGPIHPVHMALICSSGITQPVDPDGENKVFLCTEWMSGPAVQPEGMYRSFLDFPM